MTTVVTLVCPCCSSTVDARTGPDIETFECQVCEQVWEMHVDPERFAAYSL